MNARMKAMSGTMLKALSATQQDVLVEMWEVDFRALGGEVFRFCNQVNELNQAVVWKGQEYTPCPISAEGFEMTSQGAGNRPTLTVSNLLGLTLNGAPPRGVDFIDWALTSVASAENTNSPYAGAELIEGK